MHGPSEPINTADVILQLRLFDVSCHAVVAYDIVLLKAGTDAGQARCPYMRPFSAGSRLSPAFIKPWMDEIISREKTEWGYTSLNQRRGVTVMRAATAPVSNRDSDADRLAVLPWFPAKYPGTSHETLLDSLTRVVAHFDLVPCNCLSTETILNQKLA